MGISGWNSDGVEKSFRKMLQSDFETFGHVDSVHSYDVGTRKSRRTLLAAERTSLPAYPVRSQA